jgi:hypothetical protein
MENRFTDIIQLIKQSRTNAIKAVDTELINLFIEDQKKIQNERIIKTTSQLE